MHISTEDQRTAELRNLRVRWLILAGLFALGAAGRMSALEWGLLSLLVALGVFSFIGCRSLHAYERYGSRLATAVRTVDFAFLVGISISTTFRAENVWLATIPLLMLEANTRRSPVRIALFGGMILASSWALHFAKVLPASSVQLTTALISLTGVISYLLISLSAREDKLNSHDRRFEAMISSSSALARSRNLISMLDSILKSAVTEVGGDSGYVMLVDEEKPTVLRTEVAFANAGEFDFPEHLSVGEGISGYVVEMSQPIALQNEKRKELECDGIEVGVRSVVSVPLTSRILVGSNESAQEQTLGALTITGNASGAKFGIEEVELLTSLGSLMAVAVANARMEGRQRTTFLRTLESLATALEARDEYTRGHSQRVCEVSMMLAERLGFGGEALEELRVGTILHDIGKIGVPDEILNKKGRLDDEEFKIMKSHPVIGYEICKPLMLEEGVLMIIRNHHEKLDGSGYPDGLRGGELPLSLRVVCVADAFDAMSSKRPYRSVMAIEDVFSELSKGAGIQFDPVVVEALRDLLPTERMQHCYSQYWPALEKAA